MVTQQRLTTSAEFEAFIERPEHTERRFELIHGEIVEKVPTEEHGVLAALLSGEIYLTLKPHPIGRVAVEARHKNPDDDHNSRLPDVAFTRSERALPITTSGAVPRMPDLCVEIQSPNDSPLSLREKALYYLKNGTQTVWLVYPRRQQVEVHTADAIQVLGMGDVLEGGEVLPGFASAVKEIFKG